MRKTSSTQPDCKLSREDLIERAREIDAADRKTNDRTVSIYGRIATLLERGIKGARAKHSVVQGLINQAWREAALECAAAPEKFPHHILTQLADALEKDLKCRMRAVSAGTQASEGWGTDDELRLVEHLARRKDAPELLRRYLEAFQHRTDLSGVDADAIVHRARTLLSEHERNRLSQEKR